MLVREGWEERAAQIPGYRVSGGLETGQAFLPLLPSPHPKFRIVNVTENNGNNWKTFGVESKCFSQ